MGKRKLKSEHTFRVSFVRGLEKWGSNWKGIRRNGKTPWTLELQNWSTIADPSRMTVLDKRLSLRASALSTENWR